MKKEKRNAWRPKTDDPKQTITFGLKTSEIEILGGKKNVASIGKSSALKEIQKIKKKIKSQRIYEVAGK